VAWDVADREEAQIAADLVSRACLRERISKGRPQPLILHADNGNAMRQPLWKDGWRSWGCSGPSPDQGSATTTPTQSRCSTPCRRSPAERLVPAGLPPAAIPERGRGLQLGGSIRFVTPSQRHSGKAIEICRHRARVYELARQLHPLRWTGTTRCWHQPEVVWINPPPPENDAKPATLVVAA
jgi:putative transposase